MKKFIKIAIILILSIVLIAGFILAITVYPEIMLRNKIEYKNYVVHSTNTIDQSIVEILEKVDNQVKQCEIYQDNIGHRIFFTTVINSLCLFMGKSLGFRVTH
ncbi:MAG: hypothetical protein GX180_08280 [Enterococcus sp.]|nr:hypothetical protein [Enterococcus sp.]